jgi:hypothetical protein
MKTKIGICYRVILFALIMSLNTSLIVSGTVIYLHTQSFAQFIKVWLSSFVVAWPIVFAAILVIAPLVNKFLNLFVEEH